MRLADQAKQGAAWQLIGAFGNKALNFASTLVLARLLAPDDFGLIGMCWVVVGFIQVLSKFGFAQGLIQRQHDVEEYADAVFQLNLLVGFLLASIQIAVAPWAARVYGVPQIQPLLQVMALSFIIDSWSAVHWTLLTKELRFKRIVVASLALTTLTTALTIGMAFLGFKVWSFVWPIVLTGPIRGIVGWRLCPWRPRWRWSRRHGREMFVFGRNLFIGDVALYLQNNGDNFLVGKYLGQYALGIYSFAYNQAMVAVNNITFAISQILLPTFSRLQHDREELRRIYFKIVRAIATLAFPVVVWQFIMAPELISVVFTDKWLPAVWPFRLMLVWGLLRSIGSPAGSIPTAIGRTDISVKCSPICLVALAGFFIGVRYGVTGVAASLLVTLGTFFWIFQAIVFRLVQWPYRHLFQAVGPALGSAFLMGACTWGLELTGRSLACPAGWQLVVSLPLSGLVYAGFLRTAFPEVFAEVVGGFRSTGMGFLADLRAMKNHFTPGAQEVS